MKSVIAVENLSFGYENEPILDKLTFEVAEGTFLAIAGPNGAGKTTLLHLLCGSLGSRAGTIEISGKALRSYSVKELAQKIALVRQEFVPAFDFSVAELVSMARTPHFGTFGFETSIDKEMVAEALEMTDTAQFASRRLGQLSAGERQRVFIARALAQDSPILLLDEPTSFLDLRHQVGIYDLLKKMQIDNGKTIIAVTHEINLAAQYCDLILLLGPDSRYYIGPPNDVFSARKIEEVFSVRAFAGRVHEQKFFIPLGKLAKDADIIADKE